MGVPEWEAGQMRRSGENSLMRHGNGRSVGIPPLNLASLRSFGFGRNDMGKGVVFTIRRFLGSLGGSREAAAEPVRSVFGRNDKGYARFGKWVIW